MNNRRSFFKKVLGASSLLSLQGLSQTVQAESLKDAVHNLHQLDVSKAMQSEDLWMQVRAAYTVSKGAINFNNGGVSPQPTLVLDAEKKYLEVINEMPSKQLWRVFLRNRTLLKRKLSKLAGCDPEELAIVQNTTEGINTIMLGQDWKAGDEVILSKQDYSTAKVGWEQLARRRKVKLVWASLPSPVEDDEVIIDAYTKLITPRTKFMHITQMINWTGQVIPVEVITKLCTVARAKGIFTLVDGAHSFAHLDFKVSDLQCDAFATSLHKWLCAPLGTGALYVRKESIGKVWSMYPSFEDEKDKINKFEHTGTISLAKEEATHTAIDFHNNLTTALKEMRLRYLKNYWVDQLKDNERVIWHTSFDDRYSGGMVLFDIKDGSYNSLSLTLRSKFNIHHTKSLVEGAQGIRISPNIYTSLEELDYLVEILMNELK